ncbi:putative hemolysin-III channel protein Izh2 [Fimicolochytrium jonesii]|uniref:putative hemolysin-III channel protein Izh2 n=1 Tax=Fimicolochytrium jonesii TaxID=1396493 RepID=UPI0022FE7E54|nr:putative hemolysin-III channel protein Izh2 [Fimicolochytrium jonesii]KAI8827154.1 putative hemolysin-III channel protein Izh2 [Fimicolochytrium jonesii]
MGASRAKAGNISHVRTVQKGTDTPATPNRGSKPRKRQVVRKKSFTRGEGEEEESLVKVAKKMVKTLHFNELLPWQQDDYYIHTGYRPLQDSYIGCIRTLSYIHNETGNIFSHKLGALLFAAAFYFTFTYNILGETVKVARWGDYAAFGVFLLSAVVCFSLSAWFHTVICHSQRVCILFNKIDYFGIVVLICGSTYPSLYWGFSCHPHFRVVYCTMTTIFGGMTMYTSLASRFSTPNHRDIRTASFVGLGLSGLIPLLHGFYLHGIATSIEAVSFWHLMGMAAFYIVGAIVYTLRVPERIFPGRFDIWGHSHQIFHVLVLGGAITHYLGLVKSCRYWREGTPPCQL